MFCLSSHWFVVLFVFVVIGQCDYLVLVLVLWQLSEKQLYEIGIPLDLFRGLFILLFYFQILIL